MKCLETRTRQGMRWRRYRTVEGAILTTFEVPAEVVRYLGAARLKVVLERAKRTEQRKRRTARAQSLLVEGWKPAAVASELGLSESMVRRYAQRLRA